MTTVRRLLAVAAILALAAISTRSLIWGGPAVNTKDRGLRFPADGSKPAYHKNDTDFEQDLTRAKFDGQNLVVYPAPDKGLLWALQVRPKLADAPRRPRDILLMVNTSASMGGKFAVSLTAARQLAEEIVKKAGKDDRVSLWTVNVSFGRFTRNLTRGFRSPAEKSREFKKAFEDLQNEYPAGGTDLKSGLTQAVKSFPDEPGREQLLVFMGNGQSLEPITDDDRSDLCRQMVRRRIVFFPVPLGEHLNPENLHGLASGTGGLAVRVQMHEAVADAYKRFEQTVAGPVLYPTKFRVEGATEFFPKELPPLRTDAPTLVAGRMGRGRSLSYRIEGEVAGKAVAPIRVTETVPAADSDNYFLINLLTQWGRAKEQPALIRADRALVFAFEQSRLAREEALALAQMALQDNELDAARRMFARARRIDPKCGEADAGLQIVARMKDGRLTRKQFLEELNKPRGKGVLIEKKDGKVQARRVNLEQLVQNNDRAGGRDRRRGQGDNAGGDQGDDLLREHRDRIVVEEQRTTEAVDVAMRRARQILATDPEGAHDLLKRTLLMVRDHPDLGDRVRRGLLSRVENGLRDVDLRGAQVRERREEQLRIRALANELYAQRVEREAAENKVAARLRVYRDLMNHARFEEAAAQAVAIRDDAEVNGQPVPPQAVAGYMIALTSTHIRESLQLRRRKEAAFLQDLMLIDKSSIPFPDEPPIHFPPAAKWRELTRLHKRFESSGFSERDEKARQRALAIEKSLNKPMTIDKEIENMPIREVLGTLEDNLDTTIIIDSNAFKEEAGEGGEAVDTANIKLPKMTNVAIVTVLRMVLSQLPGGATYLIRRDHIEITTGKRALAEKVVRVYPVADLIVPIPKAINQQAILSSISIFGTQYGLAGIAGTTGLAGLAGFGGIPGFGGLAGIGGIGGIGGLAGIGGGLAGIGGIGGIGGGLAGIGGIGGGIGGLAGAAGIGGLVGVAGFGGMGGFGGLGGAGGLAGGSFTGVGGMGQFGNLGAQFGFQGRLQDRELVLLIRQVIGTPEDWAPLRGLNLGAGGRLPGGGAEGGLPIDEEGVSKDPRTWNDLGFFPPAMALVIKGTSRIHTSLGGGVLNVKKDEGLGALPMKREGLLGKNGRKKDPLDKGDKVGGDRRDREDKFTKKKGRKGDGDQLAKAKGGKRPDKLTAPDAKKIWNDALARSVNDPRLIIAVADFLAQIHKMDHAGEFLKANLRQGIVARPWVFEALALALECNGGSPDEIKRARLSAMDLEPQDARGYLLAARAMADNNNLDRALTFCRLAAQREPNVPYAYADALVYAEKARDVGAVEWAAGNLARKDWLLDNAKYQDMAQAKLDALAKTLKGDRRLGEVERARKTVERLRERDLVIYLSWSPGESGPADLDLEVKEPCGSLCSCLQRLTPGGGMLLGDTLAEQNRETYVAAEAFPGEYTVTVRRIWGRPLGSKAKLVIITHQGTPEEERREEVIRFDRTHTLKVKLAGGRRTATAKVPPEAAYRRPTTKPEPGGTGNIMTKLRDMADPEFNNTSTTGGIPLARPAAAPLPGSPAGQVAFQTGVEAFGSAGVDLTARAEVSADRRYVRLSVSPVFQTLGRSSNDLLVTLPLIPGGGK
jgi:hypothetical protein